MLIKGSIDVIMAKTAVSMVLLCIYRDGRFANFA